MDRTNFRYLASAALFLIAGASFVFMVLQSDKLAAFTQIALFLLIVGIGIAALFVFSYQTLGPAEVLILSRPGQQKVIRGGGLISPLTSGVTRFSISPILIEYPGNRENGSTLRRDVLITRDGVPVIVDVAILVFVEDVDDRILTAFRYFGNRTDAEIRRYFQRALAGLVSDLVAEITYNDAANRVEVLNRLSAQLNLADVGYSHGTPQLGNLTCVDIDDADLKSADNCVKEMAERITDAESERADESERKKIERDRRIARAKALADLKRLREEQIVGQRTERKQEAIEAERAARLARAKNQELLSEIEFSTQLEQKLRRELQLEERRRDLKAAEAFTGAELRIKATDTECAIKKKLLNQLTAEQDAVITLERRRLDVREKGLRSNKEFEAGDLSYQLKKQAISALAEDSRERAKSALGSLANSRMTVVSDAKTAFDLLNEQAKSLALRSRIEEILSAVKDIGFDDVVRGTRDFLDGFAASAQAAPSTDSARTNSSDRPDKNFEP